MNGIKKIKQRLFRGYFRVRAHIHVRHWRGHGIHSPFMYGIVRNVFMKDRMRYDALRRAAQQAGRAPARGENPEPLHALPAGQFYADPERRPSETGIRAQPLHTASGRDVGNHRGDGAPGLGRQRLHDHPVSAPERAPLALRATDLAALPVRQRRPARHDDLLFQPQTSAPTLPHITY